jgi:alpha-N-arabinofuranosidase
VDSQPQAFVVVDPARRHLEYSRHVFGHFIEHFHRQVYGGIYEPGSPLADDRGFRLDVLQALRELRVPNVRWPGGCFVSAYHWIDGIGPRREPVYDPAWRVTDPNTFGTDEFVEWCSELGAKPYICTNGGSGTPEEMANWLEYANLKVGSRWSNLRARTGHKEPYDIPFWSIGNENYGDWEIGAKTGPEWAAFVREAGKRMRRIDPSVKLLAAAVDDTEWALPLLREAGQFLDYISLHGYWDKLGTVNEPSPYLACMAMTLQPERLIEWARALIVTSGQAHVKIAFDEWNLRGWHHPWGPDGPAIAARDLNDDNSTYTMADAVFAAVFLNSCIRNGDIVGMANIAPTVNTRGPLFVHKEGIVKRTTFHVISMYANLLGPRSVDSAVSSVNLRTGSGDVPLIDAIATCGDDGQLTVVLVNKAGSREAPVHLRVSGKPVTGTRKGVVLSGPSPDAYNDVASPSLVIPKETTLEFHNGVAVVPPHSVTFCFIDGSRSTADDLEWSRTSTGPWIR